MTFDDGDLRELFRSSGPSDAELAGDRVGLQARLRQRVLRRRATVGAVAAALFALGGFLLAGTESADGDDVEIDDRVVTQPTTTATTEVDPTSSSTPTTAESTTSTSTTTSSTLPPPPSIRDIDLESATYADACDGHRPEGDGITATLDGGTADVTGTNSWIFVVYLEAVGYADADGDGDEDALISLRCDVGDGGGSSQIRAYRAAPGGGIEQIGSSTVFDSSTYNPYGASVAGLAVTVETFLLDDQGGCCTARVHETWTFDGSAFVLTDTVPIS